MNRFIFKSLILRPPPCHIAAMGAAVHVNPSADV